MFHTMLDAVGNILRVQVAAAVVHGTVTKTTRLPNNASIFRAELYVISLAPAVIRRRKEKNFIIFRLHVKPGRYKDLSLK